MPFLLSKGLVEINTALNDPTTVRVDRLVLHMEFPPITANC